MKDVDDAYNDKDDRPEHKNTTQGIGDIRPADFAHPTQLDKDQHGSQERSDQNDHAAKFLHSQEVALFPAFIPAGLHDILPTTLAEARGPLVKRRPQVLVLVLVLVVTTMRPHGR